MIARLIHACIANRVLVLVAAALLAVVGIWSVKNTPLDALPDLSDTQVIIRTQWAGQTPRIIEDQVTYPLATTMLSVPGVKAVRGFSFFGDSFVYILFDDATDLYWARSRVLEYLSQVRDRLPPNVNPALGPDATGLGWIYQYALVDRTGQRDVGQLRALQDWFLRYELKTVPDVAEVASVGGAVRAWQIQPDPQALAARGLTVAELIEAVDAANGATGGSVIEQGEAELMVRSEGYLRTQEAFEQVPVTGNDGIPVLLGEVATISRGPVFRRGIAELDGQGEVAGGVIVLRTGKDALGAIWNVKARLQALQSSLPEGVEVVPVYDRSELIQDAVRNLTHKLGEEFLVVALVCLLFLWHLRSALVAVITLPLGILAAFIVMHAQGISANLLSLGGIAIAIGAMVDAAVVMIENAHKHLEHWREAHGREPQGEERWQLMARSAAEVGPALFASLLVITLSFVPVFALQAQEGRLFSPLAYTKTYAMAAAAGLSVTLIPVLMGYLIRGRIRPEQQNPINRILIAGYRPILLWVLKHPGVTLLLSGLLLVLTLIPFSRLGSEFMPPLEEGSLLYMPTALPGLSADKARQLLQLSGRMIKTVPEVEHVFGKAGRAESATDPAPIEMFETTVTFKPRDQWRPGMTPQKLRQELDAAVKIPGLTNLWVPPIRNRIDMLATGIKSPIGIKVSGPDVEQIERLSQQIEQVAKTVPGVSSALAERVTGGRYVDVQVRPEIAARYGFTQGQLQQLIATVVGGDPIGETIEGRERYPIVLRYPRGQRDSLQALQDLPLIAPGGVQLTLSQVAELSISPGPPMLKSDNGRLVGYIYVDVADRDLGSVVQDLQAAVQTQVSLPAGYGLAWSGQYEYLQRALARLQWVVPAALAIIFLVIWMVFRRLSDVSIILLSLPLALVGGFWLIWGLGHAISVASMIGFIALGGVAAEFGVIMLLYLRHAWEQRLASGAPEDVSTLQEAIYEGAVQRVRPKAMTVAVILAGLFPLFVGAGAGSEVMQRIAAPMLGGMLTAPVLSMVVIPAAFYLVRRRGLRAARGDQ
ncbi:MULTISPECIES: efflux RND transporter permease subunit [Stenotrophomonas maltophilia group]|uniref:efflux RND transporter permease subunit n=1 Tax=Stenotrophomonas maltophilia group TaxID=995085 RepID=UPI0003903E89|nr:MULTISPECIES: CusA/CzcA family heavy metal efflux RND transporter [Stenotrophomonas maltophilia group]EQM88061.1 cation transporter [Stenotrophomonas maltophilia MF89]MBA0271665.1 CusA/CzcA family heavy metal efflux RND transporter [Stenotrophomonas maltophilia]MBH1388160.1 efflux RND transporter permease subunit [Stenotrophomonas maltophilia]MBH1621760.1 efflux RND transporter permease subunit [Stenotrophomonas maltophilia]MBN5107623.1 efflux RND transporter permease subunit [Stenotrophomo